jgi:4-amino-4-deoxy-L-arabinose transferase-like glycosyltransferase
VGTRNTPGDPIFIFLFSLLLIAPGTGGKDSPGQGDEIMHIRTVQDSYKAGTFYVPTVQGYPNYFKPPLLFWSGLLTRHLLGPGLFGARASSVLFAALTAVLLYWMLVYARVGRITAIATSFAYVCSVGTMKFGRLLMMEQGMAFFFTAFVFLFLVHYRTGKFWPIILAGFLSGVAFLFKGPLFIIYCGMVMAVWAMILIFRFGEGFKWKGSHKILPIIRTGFIFLLVASIPATLWVISILRAGNEGKALIKYFFIVENLGKFAGENQAWFGIIAGLLTYSMPWTLILAVGSFFVFRKETRSFADLASKIMLLSAICITLLHAIPYRKAAYYSLPFMPIIFASVATALRDYWRLEKAARVSLLVIGILTPLLTILLWFASHSLWSLLFLAPLVLYIFLIWFLKTQTAARLLSKLPDAPYMNTLSIVGVVFVLSLQFVLYPLANKNVMPTEKISQFSRNLCVLSNESWDAMELKNLLPETNIRVSIPGSPVTCADGSFGVFYVPDMPNQEHMMDSLLFPAYRKADEWEIWRRRMNAIDVMRYIAGEDQIIVNAQYFVPNKVEKK